MTPTTAEARSLLTAMSAARAGWGALQVLAPTVMGRQLFSDDAERSATLLRMKGVRDLAMGLGTLGAADDALTEWLQAGVVVDAVDTITTIVDRGRTMRPRTILLGTAAGIGSILVGLAALDALDR